MPPLLRRAEPRDFSALSDFINSLNYSHRHLDWRDPLEWLGRQPFWLCEENDNILAALACQAEPEEVAWVRLFAVALRTSPDRAWKQLFDRSLEDLRQLNPKPALVSLALRDWYEDLLIRNGFVHHQDIVVFLFDQQPPPAPRINPQIHFRQMVTADLPRVAVLDHLAFEPIWRMSEDDLRYAEGKSSYCTVAELEGNIVGYTMSSSSSMYAHLARLAVDPRLQRQHLGYALVQDLLDHFINQLRYWGVTLNTQHDNHASLALYHHLGFRETGERFPVFIYPY